ncbi:MAG TPA: serine/threonine-protein kinase [Bryobacteraceae bacterium]|jgi:serine/threonine-protein kinase|nr:serine/threonine-protein kinase [Bryobacteraceae bacterium]
MPIQIGDIVGDYQVTGVLGRGGMGKVFRVRSMLTDREEAMKVVLGGLEEDPAFVDRFLREIKVHASLQHPNIAALYSAHRIGDRLVMILELVEGVSLEDRLRPEGMAADEAIGYARQVLAALAFAHDHGVIHRDIKPANILIGAGGVVKLTDFGIARSKASTRLTGAGLAVGTLAYMSPEQIIGGEVDARSDIYSLGLALYEMVTGRRPVHGDTEHALMHAQLNVTPPEPLLVNPRTPPHVSAAIMRALAKNPAQRFQTAREFQMALQSAGAATTPLSSAATLTMAASPELIALESRLSRVIGPIAKRMVADAARRYSTVVEIQQALAEQLDNPKDREAFLKTSSSSAATVSRPSTQAPVFETSQLDRLAQALAPFLGPIAKVVVARAAKSARSLEELRSTLASEIDAPADRARFMEQTR